MEHDEASALFTVRGGGGGGGGGPMQQPSDLMAGLFFQYQCVVS